MRTITLTRKAIARNTESPGSYQLDLSITQATDITTKLFLKQRSTRFDGQVIDDFIGIPTPADLEDYTEDNPAEGTTIYRTNTISLIATDPALLEEAFKTILSELQLLVEQADVLANLPTDKVYTIQAGQITESDPAP